MPRRFPPPLPSNGHAMQRLMGRYRWWALELWSLLGLTSEFFKGFWKLHYLGPCVTVFGSARFPQGHRYYELARQVGQELAAAGFTTMTGGGPGIMEAANRGAKEAGGLSVGCNIHLPREQAPNPYLDRWVTIDRFYVRKVLLTRYSYAFVVLPGGFGTFDELFEVLTLIQTGKVSDFPMVLMPSDFWAPLVAMARDTMVANGTISEQDAEHLLVMDSPQEAVAHIRRTALEKYGLSYGTLRRRWFGGQ